MKIIAFFLFTIPSLLSQNIVWERMTAPNQIISDMIFMGNGYILAGTYAAGIFISSDKGESWYNSNQGLENENVYAVEMNSLGKIFVGTGGNGIYISSDEGRTWEYCGLNGIYINTINILNDNEIFAGTFGAGVFYSSDGGENWFNRSNGIYFPVIMTMAIKDSNLVFTGTDTGYMYRTTNKGLEWIEVNNGLPYTVANTIIVDKDGILIVGNDQGVYVSGNNGDLWIRRVYGLDEKNVLAATINSSNHIFISIFGDGIYRSKNQGNNWIKESTGLGNIDIYRFLVSEDDFIYASGWAYDFFRTVYSTVVTVDENNNIPSKIKLLQNYPNPFNPSTTIKYEIPERTFVTIKVFDVLGKEVTTLVNEEKPAGNYELKFYAKGLPSGIYFYLLQVQELIQTKKMLFLK